MLKNMKKSTKSNVITLGIVVGFYVLIQILSAAGALTNSFSGQLVPICAYVIMAVSLNLTVGMLGELSLGHAGFMSVGAFSGTLVYVVMSENAPQPLALLLAFVVGGAVAGLFGVLVGIPVLRLSGDYLAIVTLAFGEIVKNVMNACYLGVDSHGLHFSLKDSASLNLEVDGKVLINGAMGITGIKKASTFTIGIVLVIITLLVILNLVNSRAGRAIKAIRDNEIAARSVGIPITKYKLMAFVTSAVFAGVAGVLYALNYSSLVAKKFDYNTSILILVFVVLGGIGNLRGSVIAAAVLTVLPELLRSMNDYRMLIYAIVLIVVMIFNQSPEMIALRKRLTARFRKEDAEGKGTKDKEVGGQAVLGRQVVIAMLEVSNLGIAFGGLQAVAQLDLSIEKGHLYGLIGPNGAGKTTVFNMLTGVYKPTEGNIILDGKDITGQNPELISKSGIARTFQNIRLFNDMTVLDNVKVGLHNQIRYNMWTGILRLPAYKEKEHEMNREAMKLLKIFDLDKEADYKASQLPYGKQRKLEIARALATNPKLLLLDEPAAGMNPNETEELMHTIHSVRDQFGVAILLIEHDMNFVMGICEEITVLDYGRVIARGDGKAIRNNPKVIAAYLGGD